MHIPVIKLRQAEINNDVYLEPSEPIVEVVKPIKRGLNISWRTDVNSKQDKYLVVYTRNDTKQAVNIETTEKVAKLRELYPGAEYKIQVWNNFASR